MKGAITAMKNIDYDGYLGPRMTRDVQRRRLQHVMENELTELQRRAVIGYYLEKKTMRELAQERGVNKSTVCRTLQRARVRQRRQKSAPDRSSQGKGGSWDLTPRQRGAGT